MTAPTVQCPSCHSSVPGHSRFCLNCGSQVSEPSLGGLLATAPDPHPLLARLRADLDAEYDVQRELGRGGMAVVFFAVERELRRPVAIKALPPEMALEPKVAERFRREARTAASLDHPNIIPVYRVGQAGNIQYIVTKYIEGRSLDSILAAQGALPISVTLTVLRAVTGALAFAHSRGIIHRDIKPANILIDTDGRIVVSDFGIARAIEDATITATGAVVGTPAFMSPEQCSGQTLGPQCDQYALGAVTFQMVTGDVPFSAPTIAAVMQHHFFTPVPDINRIREAVPAELVDLIRRALAKKPEDRFASTDEMVAAVEAIPFSEAVRKRADAALRELARGVAIDRISLTGSAHGEATVVSGSIEPPPPDTASVQSRGRTESTTGAGGVPPGGDALVADTSTTTGPAGTRVLSASEPAPVESSVAAPAPDPAAPSGTTGWRSARRSLGAEDKRSIVPWILMGVVGIGLLVGASMMYRQASSSRGTEGAWRFFGDAQPYVDRAMEAKARGDRAAAKGDLGEAIQLVSTHPVALREMGTLLYEEANYDLARRFLVRAVRVAPQDTAALNALGCTLVKLDRATEAERFFARTGSSARSCR